MSSAHEHGGTDGAAPRGRHLRSVSGRSSRARPGPGAGPAQLQLTEVWDRHGASVYTLACALLGDEAAATRAVTLGMTDLARSIRDLSTEDALRRLARHVYWRSQELVPDTPRTLDLPPAMVWLGRVAPLQRACLALCLFGGHTHREAADLLGVPPVTVAELLTAGLRELGGLAGSTTTTSMPAQLLPH